MRLLIVPTAALAAALTAALAGPSASAQVHDDFHDACTDISRENRIAGAVIGGVLGGLIGNEAAAQGVQVEGRTLGALLGSVAGAEIGRGVSDCDPKRYNIYQTTEYSRRYEHYDPHAYERPVSQRQGVNYGENQAYGPESDLYGGTSDGYSSGSNKPAAVECETITRITTLPDGREIHEPVRACRRAYYGDWTLED